MPELEVPVPEVQVQAVQVPAVPELELQEWVRLGRPRQVRSDR
jgi:hypothetical protein